MVMTTMTEATSKLRPINKAVAGITGGVVGVLTALNVASKGTQTTLTGQFQTLVSHIIGPAGSTAVFGPGSYPAQTINPRGMLNAATIAGAVLLIVDYGLNTFLDGEANYRWVHPWFLAIGGGLFAGGLFGGVFDPYSGGRGGGTVGVGAGYVSGFAGSRAGGAASRVQGFGGTFSS